MVQEGQIRKKYPSELTDEQWAIVAPLIPPAKRSPRGGRPRLGRSTCEKSSIRCST
jgi:transposase